MHLIRQSIENLDAAWFPIAALVLFFTALAWLFAWAAKMPDTYGRRMSNLPLADDVDVVSQVSESDPSNHP